MTSTALLNLVCPQALALLLLNQMGDPDRAPLVQKLSAYVAQVRVLDTLLMF